MKDPFLEQQWQDLGQRLQRCAAHIAGADQALAAEFAEQAAGFADNAPPDRYPDFLHRVREAAGIAVQWQARRDSQTAPPSVEPQQETSAQVKSTV